jgi:tyrosine aminotransferase
MAEIVALSDELGIPLICDEVYYGLSFDPNREHVSFSHFHSQIPMICIGSLSKNYCVPGWRCGWSLVYNTHGYFDTIMEHMAKHATILIHPNSLVQHALPKILKETPESHFENLKSKLKSATDEAYDKLENINGLTPIKASAAMYMMVKIDFSKFKDIDGDVDFCQKLLKEQNCFTFPSTCFYSDGAFRMITCTTPEIIGDFAERL